MFTAPGNPDGEDWDGAMLIAHTVESVDELCGGNAVAFPLGAFYYVDGSMDYGVIQRMVASAPKRKGTVRLVNCRRTRALSTCREALRLRVR